MSSLDVLRGIWSAQLSQDLVGWSRLDAPDDSEVAPTIWAPLGSAWLVARTARVIIDGEPVDPMEAIGQALPFDDRHPTGEQIVRAVEHALEGEAWPDRLPEDPRAAEVLFSELWSATRRRCVSAPVLHRELAQRWGISDPRMLSYLSRLEPEPFDRCLDFAEVILDDVEDARTQQLLLVLWNKLGQREEENVDRGNGPLPRHLVDLAHSAQVVLRMERSIKKFAPGWGAEMQAPADNALALIAAHRSHLADALSHFSGYEVELFRTAVFGQPTA